MSARDLSLWHDTLPADDDLSPRPALPGDISADVAIVGDEPVMRATVVTRTGEANYLTRQPWDTMAPRLLHFPEPSQFHF